MLVLQQDLKGSTSQYSRYFRSSPKQVSQSCPLDLTSGGEKHPSSRKIFVKHSVLLRHFILLVDISKIFSWNRLTLSLKAISWVTLTMYR